MVGLLGLGEEDRRLVRPDLLLLVLRQARPGEDVALALDLLDHGRRGTGDVHEGSAVIQGHQPLDGDQRGSQDEDGVDAHRDHPPGRVAEHAGFLLDHHVLAIVDVDLFFHGRTPLQTGLQPRSPEEATGVLTGRGIKGSGEHQV